MFIPYFDNNYFYYMSFLPPNCDKPPTIYSILNSIVNGGKEPADYTPINELAKYGRTTIFNFDYPLTDKISKENFECMILNHYMMRRIGYETVTAFRLQLNVKLNSIMPLFNKMFDAIDGWSIFKDGEKTVRYGRDDILSEMTGETNTSSTSDRRCSDTPQNELANVRDGKYVTEYNYDSNSASDESTNNSTQTKDYTEIIEKTEGNKIEILKQMEQDITSIYELIFQKLDDLFYGLV